MGFLELASQRFSVRSFSDKPVEQEKTDKILKAAQLAPTAVNFQPQMIYVLKSPEAMEKINHLCRCIYGAPMNKYFLHQQMPIISSRYWNMVHGNTPDEIMRDEEGLQVLRVLARNMAWFLKLKEAGEKAGVPLPMQEKVRIYVVTNDDNPLQISFVAISISCSTGICFPSFTHCR